MNYYIDIMDFKEYIEAGYNYSDVLINGSIQTRVNFTKQKTGYGFKNFFVCPICGTRHSELYQYQDKYICRSCYPRNIYKYIQNVPKGGYKYITYRMKRFADYHGIELKGFPFDYLEYDRKPKYKHWETWCNNLEVLQALENMRYQAHAFGKLWNSKTVNSILTRTNSLLYLFNLSEMSDRCNRILWDKGVDMNTDL